MMLLEGKFSSDILVIYIFFILKVSKHGDYLNNIYIIMISLKHYIDFLQYISGEFILHKILKID